jgi:hypothetical protein
VATATAAAPAPVTSVTAAPIVVNATVVTATAGALPPTFSVVFNATGAQAFAIAFGGMLAAPAVLVGVAPQAGTAAAAGVAPSLIESGAFRPSTGDAAASALAPTIDFTLLLVTPIGDISLVDIVEPDEGWLTTTPTTPLNLTTV